MQEKEKVETFWANIHSRSNKLPTILFFQNAFVKERYGKKSFSRFFLKTPSPPCFGKTDKKS